MNGSEFLGHLIDPVRIGIGLEVIGLEVFIVSFVIDGVRMELPLPFIPVAIGSNRRDGTGIKTT